MIDEPTKQKRLLFISVAVLIVIAAAGIYWGTNKKQAGSTDENQPPSPAPVAISSVTSIQGVIKAIAGGAIYVEMDNPDEIVAGVPTPKKVIRVALATKNTVLTITDSNVPPPFAFDPVPPPKKFTLADLKVGDSVILTSAHDMRTPESFDVTHIEVIR